MAKNAPSAYGRTLRCINDADALWTSVEGIDVVRQDMYHRLTNDTVLGPGGDGWGFDVHQLVGMQASELTSYQPTLTEVLQQDPRVETADVTLTAITTNGLADVRVAVDGMTAEGPFSLVFSVSELTTEKIEEQA